MELCRFFYPEMWMGPLPLNRAERRAAKSKTYRKAYKKPIYAKK